MGLFGDDSVTSVATSVQRVIKDNALPDAVKSGTVAALFNNGNVPDYVMENLTVGVGTKADRLYVYAKDHYPHGLPSGQFLTNNQGLSAVTAVLQAIEGGPVTVSYSRLSVPNLLHYGWIHLLADYGYDPATNHIATLSAQKNATVTMTDLVVHIPPSWRDTASREALEQWGLPPKSSGLPQELAAVPNLAGVVGFTPVMVDAGITAPYVELKYQWQEATSFAEGSLVTHTGSAAIAITGVDHNANYLQVRYVTAANTVRYWLYRVGAGAYPTLDALVSVPAQTHGTFFPFIYFRYNKQSTADNTATPVYAATRKMLKYLNIDYAAAAAAINGDASIADVEQAMLVFGVPANSTDALEQRYLYEFFAALYEGTGAQYSTATEESMQRDLFSGDILSAAPRSALVIRDQQFKMAISHQGLYRRRRAGTIGALDACTVTVGSTTRKARYQSLMGESTQLQEYTQTLPLHTFCRQVAPGIYDEVQVVDLQAQYFIWNEYTTFARGNDANLIIPLDRSITHAYMAIEREHLYARSLHYIFNSRVTTDLAWYQTDFFQGLIFVASVALLVVTYGASWKEFVLALTTTGVTMAMVLTIVTAVIKLVVFSAAFKLFVKEVGGELAMIAAIIAVASGMRAGTELGMQAPLAESLVAAGNGLLKAAGDFYQEGMASLQQEFLQLGEQQKERSALLEQANKLLETDSILSPMTFFGETPDQYYTRTVHSGNIGIIGIDAVSNYVERSLSLPTLPERFGGLADV